VPANKTLSNIYKRHQFLFDFTEITLLDTGFSFRDRWSRINIAIPKIDITEANIAEDVSIPRRLSKQHYYIIDQPNTRQIIDFVELVGLVFVIPGTPYHELGISNGIITLRHYSIRHNGGYLDSFGDNWKGFFEESNATPGETRGIIRFTNGIPYYYVRDGTAIIEINGDDIIITMQCSDEEERRIREIYPEAQSPIFLVLEF